MAIYLSSVLPEEVQKAASFGFVSGVLTNPLAIHRVGQTGLDVLDSLVGLIDGHIFYQLTASTLEARIDEAWEAYGTRPDRVVIKMICTTENLTLIKRLPEIDIAVTAIFNPIQAYAAAEAGAHYVIPYVQYAGASLSFEQGLQLVADTAALLRGSSTQILAAHFKDLNQVQQVLQAGAHDVTLPMVMLEQMGDHPLSLQVKQHMDG